MIDIQLDTTYEKGPIFLLKCMGKLIQLIVV
jgi:hypothetical protein